MAAAIVEFDALADPVRATAKDDDLFSVGGVGFIGNRTGKRGFVGRIHVGRGRGEFGSGRVDTLVNRAHAEGVAMGAHVL